MRTLGGGEEAQGTKVQGRKARTEKDEVAAGGKPSGYASGPQTFSARHLLSSVHALSDTTELQRYYAAAAEAAQDVLVESGDKDADSNADLNAIAAEGVKPLDSPR